MRFSAHGTSCYQPYHSQVVKNIAQKSNEPSSETLVYISVTAISFIPLRMIRTRFDLDRLTRAIVVNKVITNYTTGTPILHVEASFISVERGLRRGSRAEPLKYYIHFSFILKLIIFIYKQLKRSVAFSVLHLDQQVWCSAKQPFPAHQHWW